MKQTVICPLCKGKGWKRDPFGIASMTVMSWFMLMIEANRDPREETCMTKEVCYRCDGDGFIEIGR